MKSDNKFIANQNQINKTTQNSPITHTTAPNLVTRWEKKIMTLFLSLPNPGPYLACEVTEDLLHPEDEILAQQTTQQVSSQP